MLDDTREIVGLLQGNNIDFILEKITAKSLGKRGRDLVNLDSDLLIVVGSDKTLLNTFLQLGDCEIPVLPVSSMGQPDFLFDVTVSHFDSIVKDLVDHKWTVDSHKRIVANIAGKETPPILNDIAIFARRSATLIRYSLFIDGEQFLKDGSDGLIISTPTGSTAYSMSVGGPVVLHPAHVISLVPVNSVNPARRPIVVSDSSEIVIRDLSSSVTIEAILDGQIREKVDGSPVSIRTADNDAAFVKLAQERIAALRGKLIKKTEAFEDLAQDLPPSAKLVLKVLEYKGQITQKAIIDETMLPPRTVRYALSLLISEGLVKKRLSLRDSRQGLYKVTEVPREE